MKRKKILLSIIHVILAFLVLSPLFFVFTSSIRPLNEIFQNISPLSWKTFIPTSVTLESYTILFTDRGFGRVFFNTVFVAFATVAAGILFNSLAAFGFAYFDFKGKNILFILVMITFMVPFEAIAIPLYNVVDRLGWIDSYFALIVPAVANGLVILLYRQQFLDLPYALIEAARIDGASWFTIYFKIIMPLSRPITIGGAILIFVQQWESFIWPLIATRSKDYMVLQVFLGEMNTEHGMVWNELFSAAVIGIIVPAVIILYFQRYFIDSLTSTGIK